MGNAERRASGGASSNGIVRTERGLTVAGTRITLYDIMDYLQADWTADQIADMLPVLSREEVDSALAYIATHREEVEAEYQQVLQHAGEERAYWEVRNRQRFEHIRNGALPPGKAALVARLRKQMGQPAS